MRRFVVLLIAVLLLQFNWIAAASACTHEAGAGDRHFGHHQHEHKAAGAKSGEHKATSGNALADDDCAVCHLGCGAAAPPESLRLNLPLTDAPAIAPPPMILATWPDPPDRPRWTSAS